ncbi:MAG: translocation/assembly module TamB domain-containing protein, partial [Acidobacteria bacterium]|nr:translocation/assembly module TamB domain-containing protein [Acidobacteriota bacterium]
RLVLVRLGAILLAVCAALVVTALSVDLGPQLRVRAENAASKYIQRQVHIGRLSSRLIPGVFVIEDLRIEGLTPSARPFLTAKKITVKLPWWTGFSRRLMVESIDMTDWDMVIESFPGGRHNFPKFTRDSKGRGPGRFTTTLKSVVAARGQFTYVDHGTPWSTAARGMTVTVYRGATNYRGRASFSDGTIRIQSYEPVRAHMQSRFTLNGPNLHFDRIDLVSEGARSVLDGDIDLARWPEQMYRVQSRMDLATQKSIFFHRDRFNASGQGDFQGTFHYFKGGRELKGTFTSAVAGYNDWRFQNLRGSVLWLADRLEITNATTEAYGGKARFDYRLAPFGIKGTPTRALWDVQYSDIDLVRLTDFLETEGLRLSGRASGRNTFEWRLGQWALRRGGGEVTAEPPDGVRPMTRALDAERVAQQAALPVEAGPFNSRAPVGYLPIAGRVVYRLDPDWVALDRSWVASPRTYVEFDGRTAYGVRSRIPFHVTSLDWQESDRVLAGIMTAFGSPTGAIELGGSGEFDGVLLEAFAKPRIEGRFSGENLRAWDVVWGRGRASVVVENSYADVTDGVLTQGTSEVVANGRFSLGYPRRDGGEQINGRIRMSRRPLVDLRHAFELDDYPVNGLVSGEYHLYGNYETPFGFGRLVVEQGVAYGETFETATASLRFEGSGVRLDGLDLRKSTGTVTGAAWVGWDGNYSFNADGRRIPVESMVTAAFPRAPLSGLIEFNATGTGTFEEPRYDVKLRIDDLFAGEEGIGQVTARLALRGDLLTTDVEAASPRLVVSGSGRIALTPEMDAELTLRFADTSFDPYVRFFEPRLSPFTTAVAGGTVRVVGELTDLDHLVVDTRVEQLDLKLFDYRLRNEGPIELALDQHTLQIRRMRLSGEGTNLQVDGEVALHEGTLALDASGDANLGILQGFFRDLRSRGTAALTAQISGRLDKPVFSGSAALTDGRIRHFSLPHSLETINGRLSFDAGGIRVDDVTAKLGGGDVRFGGRIALKGFMPGELSLTAVGDQMHVRYPEGIRSVIDAELALRGELASPLLSGTVTVHDALWSRRFDTNTDLFNLSSGATGIAGGAASTTLPLRFDLAISAPSSLRIENNIASVVSSADLRLQGTYDRPLLFGRAEIERGNVLFEGNRYVVTRGSIGFFNPTRIEPFFDIEAETRARVPGQTYRVTLGVTGTADRFSASLNSDPPLPQVDIVALLFGQATNLENAELRALRPEASEANELELIRAGAARLIASPISAPVGRAVEQTLGIDTVQITPSLGGENDLLTPSARLIIGKRISNRAYLTFARALGTAARDQIIVLEYDQNDRVGWVITQNGDHTFAFDFRVRHSF